MLIYLFDFLDRRNHMELKASWSRANRQGNIDKNNNLLIGYKETQVCILFVEVKSGGLLF